MDFSSWVWFVLGVLVSIPVGFFVNMQTERVQRWIDSRSKVRRGLSLGKAWYEYDRVLRLRSDPHFATQFHYSRITQLMVTLAFAIACGVAVVWASVWASAWTSGPPRIDLQVITTAVIMVAMGLLGTISILLSVTSFWAYQRILRNVGDVEAYRKELRERWPEEKWE
jgi:hypothetical protein